MMTWTNVLNWQNAVGRLPLRFGVVCKIHVVKNRKEGAIWSTYAATATCSATTTATTLAVGRQRAETTATRGRRQGPEENRSATQAVCSAAMDNHVCARVVMGAMSGYFLLMLISCSSNNSISLCLTGLSLGWAVLLVCLWQLRAE